MKNKGQSAALHIIISILGSIIVFCSILCFVLLGINDANETAATEGISIAEKCIRRAVISCYAIEGSYPPDYNYIKENYGVRVDENLYDIYYSTFSSNIMPEISVCKTER